MPSPSPLPRRALALACAFACAPLLAHACATNEGIGPNEGTGGDGGRSGAGIADASDGSAGTTLLPDVLTDVGGEYVVDPDSACEKETTEAKFVPANVLFLIDKSGSMSCNPPPIQSNDACEADPKTLDPGQPTKWGITRDALESTIAGMPGSSSVGIAYFPRGSVCDKPVQPEVPIANLTAGHLAELNASLDSVAPVGATPLVGSMLNGYIYLDTASITGNVFVILITDGAESCSGDPSALIATAGKQFTDAGVRTFVIGAPGSESFRSVLSDVAFAGGTASGPGCDHGSTTSDVGDCHFDMTVAGDFSQALNDALDKISGDALSCDFSIPDRLPNGDPVDYEKVNVRYAPGSGDPEALLPFAPEGDCSTANGWRYSADRSMVLLCGEACDTVKADPTAKITIVFGCDRIQ